VVDFELFEVPAPRREIFVGLDLTVLVLVVVAEALFLSALRAGLGRLQRFRSA
jgi:hypothetical protein